MIANPKEISKEINHVDQNLAKLSPNIGIFGSGTVSKEDEFYKKAFEVASKLSSHGLSIITGGGGGIMEAANMGAQHGSGASIGFCIKLPNYEKKNQYIDEGLDFHFTNFFSRKASFLKHVSGIICFPGGIGTLDELAECLLLIRTQILSNTPLFLVGKKFWAKFIDWLSEDLVANNLAPKEILNHITITDDINEIVSEILSHKQISVDQKS